MTDPHISTQHQARKRFGQNFLHDKNVINRITQSIRINDKNPIIEIGPGLGAITEVLSSSRHITAIEIDRDLAAHLREKFPLNLTLIEQDALKVDFTNIISQMGSLPAKIVGNLPYNISTPLIFHLLESREKIDSMFFMLQREVVDRMAATPGSKIYGKLSVVVQYHCKVSPLFNISPQCFKPVPNVESTFVQLTPRTFPTRANNYAFFEKLVSTAFQQRRKTLRNSIKILLPDTLPTSIIEKLSQRAEELSVVEYVIMSNELNSL